MVARAPWRFFVPYRLRVLEAWNDFRREVVPAGYPPDLVVQLRGAFYSGIVACLTLIHAQSTKEEMDELLADMAKEVLLYRHEVYRRTHGDG